MTSSITTASRSATDLPFRAWLLALGIVAANPAAAAAEPLALFDVSAYAEIAARPNPEGHAIVLVPSLASVLLAAERSNGAALEESQVLALRDGAEVMVVPQDSAARLEQGRGYRDLDPGRCWQEWQDRRREFLNP
jgi:hypothetical protein